MKRKEKPVTTRRLTMSGTGQYKDYRLATAPLPALTYRERQALRLERMIKEARENDDEDLTFDLEMELEEALDYP